MFECLLTRQLSTMVHNEIETISNVKGYKFQIYIEIIHVLL